MNCEHCGTEDTHINHMYDLGACRDVLKAENARLKQELTIAKNMVLNWRAGEDCCDLRDAALFESAQLREKLIAAERENTLLREAHALHWLRLAMCRGILSDPNRDDEEIAEVLRTTATDDAPTDKDIERARQALAETLPQGETT